ncbi:MAG: hypothetical protein R2796_10700 [Chitinophagaceae bacterium]|nr:hypothetical protein [Chitinophagaceae bacterium]
MKKIATIFFIFFCVSITNAQSLSEVRFINGSDLKYFSFTTDQNIIIRLSPEGQIIEWGKIWNQGSYQYFPGKLQEYIGRVEKFGDEGNAANKGKVKSIGTCFIDYYSATDQPTKAGKVKSIGRAQLQYYDGYENEALRGKLKSAGPTQLQYYNSFENEAIRGKLKSIGPNRISYYTTFDDKNISGKVKQIGSVNFLWYDSRERPEFHGALKSGNVEQVIGGIKFMVR